MFYINFEDFCLSKETIKAETRQTTNREQIFKKYISVITIYSEYYEEVKSSKKDNTIGNKKAKVTTK